MEIKNIKTKIIEIDNETNIHLKYKNIENLHKIIKNEEEKLEKLNDCVERNIKSKYDNIDLEKIILKFNKTNNLEKKIKYYHSISNKIDDIIISINN